MVSNIINSGTLLRTAYFLLGIIRSYVIVKCNFNLLYDKYSLFTMHHPKFTIILRPSESLIFSKFFCDQKIALINRMNQFNVWFQIHYYFGAL